MENTALDPAYAAILEQQATQDEKSTEIALTKVDDFVKDRWKNKKSPSQLYLKYVRPLKRYLAYRAARLFDFQVFTVEYFLPASSKTSAFDWRSGTIRNISWTHANRIASIYEAEIYCYGLRKVTK